MSFEKILAKKGKTVLLVKVTKHSQDGYITEREEVEEVEAIVLPLTAEERKFWDDVGITKASLKLYTTADVKTGWLVEIDGMRLKIRAVEKYQLYKKAILEAIE